MAIGVVVVARRNAALWTQGGVGVCVGLFTASTLVAPFSPVSALLAVALTVSVFLAGIALIFECVMLPFGASALGVAVPTLLRPWVALGVLGSVSVAGGVVGAGLPGDLAIVLMRIGTPAAIAVTALVFFRSRPAS